MAINIMKLHSSLQNQYFIGSAWLLALCIAGYPLVGLTAAVLDVPSRWTSFPFRLVVVILSIVLVILALHIKRLSVWILVLIVWLGAYAVRLIYNAYLGYEGAQHEFIFFVATVMLPVLAMMRGNTTRVSELALMPIIFLAGATLAFSIGGEYLGWFGANSLMFTGRLATTTVNSITLGHLSVTLLLCCIVFFMNASLSRKSFAIMLSVLGLIILGMTSSRGALLSLLITIGIWLTLAYKQGSLRTSTSIFVVVLATTALALFWYPLQIDRLVEKSDQVRLGEIDKSPNSETLKRLKHLEVEKNNRLMLIDRAADSRKELWRNTLRAIWSFPILGVSNFEVNQGQYPHNLILEAFQNLGVFGGVIFLILLIMGLKQAFFELRSGHQLVPLLFFQSVVGSQFSGSLYGYASLWVTLALLLGCYTKRTQQEAE